MAETDLISRQQAIDAVCDEIENDYTDLYHDGYCDGVYDSVNVLKDLPSAQPDLDEWCMDCSEYDSEKHCCPRWNRVIRNALKDAQRTGEWEEIAVISDVCDINGVKTWASKMKCDQCGFTTIAIEGRFSQYNFCPNCGADCRGGQDE